MKYAITATLSVKGTVREDWSRTRQVPTFFLDPRVQGIVSEDHAKRIALDIIDPFGQYDVSVTAVMV